MQNEACVGKGCETIDKLKPQGGHRISSFVRKHE
jgi:hypothetical protein